MTRKEAEWERPARGSALLDRPQVAAGRRGPPVASGEVARFWDKVPTGWLVILGDKAAGKSVLIRQVLWEMLKSRKDGGPVPILVNATEWDASDDLRDWLEREVAVRCPWANEPIPDSQGRGMKLSLARRRPIGRRTLAGALLDARLVVPLIDGLDELPNPHEALIKLNDAFHEPSRLRRLLLTCRTEDYAKETAKGADDPQPLDGAAVIELGPLDPVKDADQVAGYLEHHGGANWDRVLQEMGRETPVGRVLRSPLYVSLAESIYNHNSGGRDRRPSSSELCDHAQFDSTKAVEDHLIGEYVKASYRDKKDGGKASLRWLTFLADRLSGNEGISWSELDRLAPRALVPVVIGLVCGVATFITAGLQGRHVGSGIGYGLGVGIICALAIGRPWRRARTSEEPKPAESIAWAFVGAVLGSVAAGVAGRLGVGHATTLFDGLPAGLGVGIAAGGTTPPKPALIGALFGSFLAGLLEGVGVGWPAGVINGLAVGLAAGFAVERVRRTYPATKEVSFDKRTGFAGAALVGAFVLLVGWHEVGLAAGAVAALFVGAACSLPFGLRPKEQDRASVATPKQALSRDRRVFWRTSLPAALAVGLAGFFGEGFASGAEKASKPGLHNLVRDGLGVGLDAALIVGLIFGFYHAAYPAYRLNSWWLALKGHLPSRPLTFLEEARDKNVMRLLGTKYQFRHERILEYLTEDRTRPRPGV